MKFDLKFLQEKGFKFQHDGEYEIADAGYLVVVYAGVDLPDQVESIRQKIFEKYSFAATWIFVRSTNAIYVTRPAGENRIFIFNPDWSHKTEYVKGKHELLEERFGPKEFDELFDVKAVHNTFYETLWNYRLDLARILKEQHGFPDKDAILIAQKLFDRIIFLYFCCESGAITQKTKDGKSISTSGREFFVLLLSEDNIARQLTRIFFEFFAKLHTDAFVLANISFNIPYLNGGLFQIDTYLGSGDSKISDPSLEFDKFDFKQLFALFNNYLWIIETRTPKSLDFQGEECSGTLTPEILGHMYEKFVITIEQLEQKSDADSFNLEKLRKLIRSRKGNKEIGAYYTPEDVVQFILSKCVFPSVLNRLNLAYNTTYEYNAFEQFWEKHKDDKKIISGFLKNLLSTKCLDPAVGSGHFLMGTAGEIFRMAKICSPALVEYDLKKEIITNCLYGVDIMPGAIEICKLRLWLWLMSSQIESGNFPPLPNIEYKIRVGNSLIGLVGTSLNFERFGKGDTPQMINPDALHTQLAQFAQEVDVYKKTPDPDGKSTSNLRRLHAQLKDIFDKAYFYEVQGVKGVKKQADLNSMNPFHWGVDFFEIFNQEPGEQGFDIILGNPPWGISVLGDHKKQILTKLKFVSTSEISATFLEREISLLKPSGFFGQILADSIVPNDTLYDIRNLIMQKFPRFYLTYIGTRPGKVFDGVEKRVCIGFGQIKAVNEELSDGQIFTTKAIMFEVKDRKLLFQDMEFHNATPYLLGPRIGVKGPSKWLLPKVGTGDIASILDRLKQLVTQESDGWMTFGRKTGLTGMLPAAKKFKMMFRGSAGYWLNALTKFPYETSSIKTVFFPSEISRDFAILLFNSHLLYLFWAVYGNFHHVKESLINKFPFPPDSSLAKYETEIRQFRIALEKDLLKNFKPASSPKDKPDGTKGRDGEFRTGYSKPIINEVEEIIGSIYGFSNNQIFFLCNYDNHIRKGDGSGQDVEED